MISKSTIKLIKSLALKKYRIKENSFLVEGDKNVIEVLHSDHIVERLFASQVFLTENKSACKNADSVSEVVHEDLRKASLLQNPQNSLAICSLPEKIELPENLNNNLSIYLDGIQDPGNVGTIIRICDWFKIEYLFFSPHTTDFFNPKVIQASMGSFSRVKCIRASYEEVAHVANISQTTIYGAFLSGANIYSENLPRKALVVVGNEGNGISKELEDKISKKIKIPEFSANDKGAESLNVSAATAIICSEFKRRNFV